MANKLQFTAVQICDEVCVPSKFTIIDSIIWREISFAVLTPNRRFLACLSDSKHANLKPEIGDGFRPFFFVLCKENILFFFFGVLITV